VDAGQAVFEAPASLQGTYGTYTFNASSGAWTYTLDNTKAEVQALTAGQTVVDRLVVKSLDGTASQSIDVTITGANDSPTISVTVGDSDAASMNSNFTQEIGGSLTFNDVDADGWTMHGAGVRLGETSTFDFANQLTAEQQSLLMSKLQNCFTLHAVAAEDMNQNNNQHWSFKTESASDFDFLPNNKTLVVEYEVSVTDAHGASGTHIVSITVTGKHTNEAPQILIDEGDAQSAELIEANAILSTSGTLTVADPDVGDVCMVKVMGVNFDGSTTFDPAALSPARLESLTASVLNWLNVPEQLDGQTPHNLTWNFNSVGNANLEWLEANEKLVLNYTIEVQDTAGAKASQVVSITIVGTDDQPAIAVLGTDAAYVVVVESPTQVDAAGTLSVNFGDRTESARLAVSGAHINLEKSLFPETLTTEDVAALETALQNRLQLWVDGTTPDGLHNVNWSLDLGGLLPEGATLALDYTFDLFNLVNGTVYGQQVVSVSISGVNDAPVVDLIGTDNDQTSFFETDSILTSSGTFSISDLDYKDAVTFEVKKVVFDAPFLSPEQLALMESAFKSFLTLSSAGSMDDFHNLKWTFNSSYSNNLDFIPEGESFYVYYTVEVKDAAGATAQKDVSVYIFGTNDAPVIQVQEGDSDQIGLTESGTSLVATGTVTLKDADYNAQVNFAVSDVALDPLVPSFLTVEQFSAIKSQLMGFMSLTALGTLDDSHNLQWTFDTTGGLNAGFIPMGETLALDYTIEAIDNKGAITTQVIHIDILGSNSAPTFELIGSDSVAASLIETDDVLKASGTMSLMDLDSNDPSNATRISVNVNGYSGGYDNAHFLNLLKLSTETNGNGEPLLVNDPHNVRWTFESTSAGDFDYLAKDQILKLEYTIEAKDSHGATSQQLVSITVTGTNDAPQVLIFAGDSAEGSVVSPTQDVTGSLSIFDEEVVAASFAGIQLDGVNITNEATQSMLFGLLRIDPTSTFETVNEPNNFDWRFKTADAVAQGWTSNLPDGNHKLTYTMDFMDTYGVQQKQDINIFFIV
jgi:VCBS repeat-containing protein